MRPGDVLTSATTGRTVTVLGVQQVVTFNGDATRGEYRVILQANDGRRIILDRDGTGAAGLTDAQVRNALTTVETNLTTKIMSWLDR